MKNLKYGEHKYFQKYVNKIAEYVRTCKLKYIERVNIDELF